MTEVVDNTYLFREDAHISRSDPKEHFTVDAYRHDTTGAGLDKPIGCIHVYHDGTAKAFREPRSKAKEVCPFYEQVR